MLPMVDLPAWLNILVIFIAWPVFHVGISYAVAMVPSSLFEGNRWPYRIATMEKSGKVYAHVLRIHRWKGRLPTCDQVFGQDFSKRTLNAHDLAYMRTFARETRRGELAHWLQIIPAFLFFLWSPWLVGILMVAYALAFNLPFIVIQRYNRARCEVAISSLERRAIRKRDTVSIPIGDVGKSPSSQPDPR